MNHLIKYFILNSLLMTSMVVHAQWSGTGPVTTFDNVGIKTSSPAVDLDVHGSGTIRATGILPKFQLFDDSSGENRVEGSLFENGDNNIQLSSFYGDLKFNTGTSGIGTFRMTIRGSSGNVGIGTLTPQQKLEVNGAIGIGNTTAGNSGTIRYNGTNFQGRHSGTWKNLDEAGGTSVWSLTGADSYFDTGRVGIGTNSPNSALHVDALSGQNPIRAAIAGQTKFHVNSNGGVSIGTPSAPPGNGLAVSGSTGIGTVSPTQKLEVVGGIKLGNTTTNINGSIRYDGTNFQGHTGGSWVNLNGGSSGGSLWSLNGPEAYYDSGNVGIGTTNPAHLLHVNGDVAIAGSVIAPSDLRLKQDIQPITAALAIVSQLSPKTYTYKSEQVAAHGLSDKQQYGLVAQELAAVLPSLIADQAIVDEDGTSYKGIEYAQLIPILTQAIKELNVELKATQEELSYERSYSKKQFKNLVSRLKALEQNMTER